MSHDDRCHCPSRINKVFRLYHAGLAFTVVLLLVTVFSGSAAALDINDTDSLDYWSDTALDFRVETDGTIRAQNILDMNGNNVNSINKIQLQNTESASNGQIAHDNSIGYLGNWGNNGNAVLWDSYNVQKGNAISISGGKGQESNPSIAVNEGGISHDNIGGVSYNDHHGVGSGIRWDGSNNIALDANDLDANGNLGQVDVDQASTRFAIDGTDVVMRLNDNSGEFRFVPYNTSSNTWWWNQNLNYDVSQRHWMIRTNLNMNGNKVASASQYETDDGLTLGACGGDNCIDVNGDLHLNHNNGNGVQIGHNGGNLNMNGQNVDNIDDITGSTSATDIYSGVGGRVLLRARGSGGTLGWYDDNNNRWVQEYNNGGNLLLDPAVNVKLENADLNVNNNELNNVQDIEMDGDIRGVGVDMSLQEVGSVLGPNNGDTDLNIRTQGGGSHVVSIEDGSSSNQDIARFNEGTQNVEIPNGNLDVGGSSVGSQTLNVDGDILTNGGEILFVNGAVRVQRGDYIGDTGGADMRLRGFHGVQLYAENTGTELLNAKDNGNLEVPNGNLNMNGNSITGTDSLEFDGGIEIGDSSTTVGSNTNAVAVGKGASASGTSASAFGYSSDASGYHASAVGYSANASGHQASAFGDDAEATKDDASAVGKAASASGTSGRRSGLMRMRLSIVRRRLGLVRMRLELKRRRLGTMRMRLMIMRRRSGLMRMQLRKARSRLATEPTLRTSMRRRSAILAGIGVVRWM